ncbi:MAG: hypothetical protein ACLGHP_01475, partial [Vicinamibacteria bacterium]
RPAGGLQSIDVPIVSQSDDAPDSVLLELPVSELTPGARERLRHILEQDVLPRELLRANPGIPPDRQIKLARVLADDPEFYADDLAWDGFPNERELQAACELIWDHLVAATGKRNGIASGRQLARRLDRFRADPNIARLVAEELTGDYADTADEAAESVMQFVRSWTDFEFPKLLRCLDNIQRVVLGRAGHRTGSYAAFAAHVEALFSPRFLAMLDEYGIPLEVARKLAPSLGKPESLDDLLEDLRVVDLSTTSLSAFERSLVDATRRRF